MRHDPFVGPDEERALVVGVLSDTHGHLYQRVKAGLRGVDHIVHAGDVGSLRVLDELRTIAPVTAVRGNCDQGLWAGSLPEEAELELGGVRILVGHIAARLRERLARSVTPSRSGGTQVVVTGHSHRPAHEERDGVVYLNPGSAGPERFGQPKTFARLSIMPASTEGLIDAGGSPARVEVEFVVVQGD